MFRRSALVRHRRRSRRGGDDCGRSSPEATRNNSVPEMARCRSATWVLQRLFGRIPPCPTGGASIECPSIEGLSGDLGQLSQPPERVPDVEEEPQAIGTDGAILGQNEHVLEEAV